MAIGLLQFVPLIGDIIDRLIPDKNAREKAKAKLAALEQSGELQLMLGQMEINKVEARHKNIWVSGWRPFIGWICGVALLLGVLVKVVLPALIVLVSVFNPGNQTELQMLLEGLETIDVGFFYPILGGLLGLGALRSFDKWKGKA